jgi:hypothetical protein
MSAITCSHCGQAVHANLFQCPHCGQQIGFPNVTTSATPEEVAALNERLKKASVDLRIRGAEATELQFRQAVEAAEAVVNRYFSEFYRLAWSDDQIFATYYQKVQAGLQLPESDQWNRLRGIADTILFGDANKQHIRFAALSLDGVGLDHYGDCSLTLKRSMIEHRATVFEQNSVIFMKRLGINGADDFEVPSGYRATWDRRGDLCVAKLSGRLKPTTSSNEFSTILLSPGINPEDDEFVEVHVWGPMTMRSFERVFVKKWAAAPSDAEINAVKARLDKIGVRFDLP